MTEYRQMISQLNTCRSPQNVPANPVEHFQPSDEEGTTMHQSNLLNDASKKSRMKKRINTELLLENYDFDVEQQAKLIEEQKQLLRIIAVMESSLA